MKTILIAEDEPEVRNYLRLALTCRGYEVEFAQNGEEAVQQVRGGQDRFSLMLLDILMPHKDGLETLREVRGISPDLPVIMLSGASAPGNIVTAMKSGAKDFLAKPVGHEELCRAIERVMLSPSTSPARVMPYAEDHGPMTLAAGTWSQRVELLLRNIGLSDVPVLLQGETGVGKEVLARKLHARSRRASGPFLKLNCAALPSELVESELFGYDRGAFTGAFKNTPGKFEMASGGTILLDEIGDMDFKLQGKLLQVLQDREYLPLGAREVQKVDVRLIAATHRDIKADIDRGRFREDLYYRLDVINIYVPSLRDRRDEILSLAELFLEKHSLAGEETLEIPHLLAEALLNYEWPGNVRELENVIKRFIVFRDPQAIIDHMLGRKRETLNSQATARNQATASEMPSNVIALTPESRKSNTMAPLSDTLNSLKRSRESEEADFLLRVLDSTRWNRKKAAGLLNMEYKTLLYRMKRLGIDAQRATAS
jgi:two-component system response regulator AtoC